jgi:CRP-like cAMP-binding protein
MEADGGVWFVGEEHQQRRWFVGEEHQQRRGMNDVQYICDRMTTALRQKINSIIPLQEVEIEYFLSKLDQQQLRKDEILLKEGDTCDFIAYVNKGALRTYLVKDGKEVNTEFFLEGSFAGAFTSFLMHQKTKLMIQALEDSSLFLISKALLQELYERNATWYAFGKYIFEQEFIKKCRRESSFLQDDALARYLTLLDQYPHIEEKVSLYHIASYLGIKPETLSRIRSGKLSGN